MYIVNCILYIGLFREIQAGELGVELFCFFVVSMGGGGFVGEVSEVVSFEVKLNHGDPFFYSPVPVNAFVF